MYLHRVVELKGGGGGEGFVMPFLFVSITFCLNDGCHKVRSSIMTSFIFIVNPKQSNRRVTLVCSSLCKSEYEIHLYDQSRLNDHQLSSIVYFKRGGSYIRNRCFSILQFLSALKLAICILRDVVKACEKYDSPI